jgi:hypothetical protein
MISLVGGANRWLLYLGYGSRLGPAIASLLWSLISVQQIDFIRPSTNNYSAQAVLTVINVEAWTLTRTLREITLFYISLLREQLILILLFSDLLSPYCCGLFLIVLSFSPYTLTPGRLPSACLAIVCRWNFYSNQLSAVIRQTARELILLLWWIKPVKLLSFFKI